MIELPKIWFLKVINMVRFRKHWCNNFPQLIFFFCEQNVFASFPVDKSKGADETEPDFNDVNNINDAETDSKPAVQFVKKKRHKKVSETHVHFSQSVMKKDDAGSSVVTIG